MKSVNPYTGDTVFEAETHGQAAIEAALTRAVSAVQKLKAMGMQARLDGLRKAAEYQVLHHPWRSHAQRVRKGGKMRN